MLNCSCFVIRSTARGNGRCIVYVCFYGNEFFPQKFNFSLVNFPPANIMLLGPFSAIPLPHLPTLNTSSTLFHNSLLTAIIAVVKMVVVVVSFCRLHTSCVKCTSSRIWQIHCSYLCNDVKGLLYRIQLLNSYTPCYRFHAKTNLIFTVSYQTQFMLYLYRVKVKDTRQ